MRYKVTFGLGFAAGYVLGARAGVERYRQIENAARRFADTPAVQQAAGVVGAQAGRLIGQAKQTVGSKVGSKVGGRFGGGTADTAYRGTTSTISPEARTAPAESTPLVTPPTSEAADDLASPYPAQDFGGHA